MRSGRRGIELPVAGLAGIVLFLFSDVIFGGRVFYDRDIHLEWYSQMEGFVRSVAAGAWPVWDNTIAFGQPLLADPSAQVAYPPTWLNLLLLPWDYYRVFVVGHCIFTAAGMLLMTRHLKASWLASFAAAGFWTACGPLLSLVNVWHHFAGACWLPWVVLAAACAVAAPGRSATFVWGGVQALQVVAGSAEMAALGVAASALWVGMGIPWRAFPGRAVLPPLGRCALAAVIAAALSAVLWLPTLDVLLRSSRSGLPEAVRATWSVPPLGLVRTLLPLIYTELPLQDRWQAGLFDTVPPFLPSLYLGLPTLALVVAARRSPDRTLWRMCALLITGGVALALGRHAPFYGFVVSVLPPLAIFRYPSKVMLIVAFAWALLVAGGVDGARSHPGGPGRGLLGLLGLGGAGIAALGVWLLLRPESLVPFLVPPPWLEPLAALSRPLAEGLVRSGAALAAAALLLVACRGRKRGPGVAAAVVICLVDLVLAHRPLNLTTPRALVAFRPPILDGLTAAEHRRLYVYEYFLSPGASERYLGRSDAYVIPWRPGVVLTPEVKALSQRLYPFPPVAARWGFEGSFDVDTRGLYPRAVSTLASALRAAERTPAHHRLLRLGAVRWVIALHTSGFEDLDLDATVPSLFPEPIRRFVVRDALPRSYVVGAAREADGLQAWEALLDPNFDLAREVVLATSVDPPSPGFQGTSRILELVSDRVLIEAELSAPGYVVLVDAYDPGWQVTVDGRPVPLLRANLAFRAVRVPAGRHRVRFSYRPASLMWGLGVSFATAVGLLSIGLSARRRGDKPGRRTTRSREDQASGPGDGNGERPDGGPEASAP